MIRKAIEMSAKEDEARRETMKVAEEAEKALGEVDSQPQASDSSNTFSPSPI